ASASQSSPLATMIAGLAWPAVVVCGLGLVLAVLAAGAIAVRRRGNLFGALVDRDAPALATSAPAAASGVLPQPRPRRVHTIVPTGISATSLTGPAFLEVVEQAGKAKALIDLTDGTITLGRDPASAAIGFADRSVSRLHARIEMDAEGTFRIFDADSTSGTWVNFGQVTAAGQALRHGDLINLGRVQLRFRLRSAEAGKIDTAPIIRPDGERSAAPLRDDTTEPYRLKRKP
ncbi:MAG: FHA domain-containing protein, partial [Chloroflexi bacterium]|nr:FHA domain-containing protein [Chloroflexota bacterium]